MSTTFTYRFIDPLFYWTAHTLIRIVGLLYFPLTVIGRENLPATGNYILASNHLSHLDPIVVGTSLYRRINYMARDTLFRQQVFAFIIRRGGAFSIKRGKADISALKEAIKRLKFYGPILVFPQGSREGVRGGGKAEAGIGFLTIKSGVPVIPVYIKGTDKVFPPGAKWFKRHPVTVTFGQPLIFPKSKNYPAIAQQILDRVLAQAPSV